jgi:hypothetical protein
MERRRSGRGGWGLGFGIFIPQRVQGRGRGLGKAIESCGTYPGSFRQPSEEERITKRSRLVGLTWVRGGKSFRTRQLNADQNLWDLQVPISAAGAIFGRKPRCAARNRDAPGGSDACSRRAFRRFPFGAHKNRENNLGVRPAIADWTSVSACSDSPADHRSFAVA